MRRGTRGPAVLEAAMTTTPPAYWMPPARWGPGRILAIVFGILLLIPGLGLSLGGGVLLWADLGDRTDGFVFSSSDHFSTDGFALTSERVDLATGADWLPVSAALGDARAEVTAADPSTAIFVGVAPAAEGTAYLGGVARSVINDLGTTSNGERFVPGAAPTGAPGDQNFWVAQTSGTGTQQLDWAPTQGQFLFVVMNADGSSGVAMDARIGATVPALAGLGWGVLGGGLFLVIIGVLLLVLAIRRPRVGRAYTGGPYVMPSGPAPVWTPPAPVDRTTAADAARTETTQRPPTT
jgi:hypothetical protein